MTLTMSSYSDVGDLDEIFYSDEESSESELFKAQKFSRIFSQKNESIFSSRYRQNSLSPDAEFNSPIYITSPINQISSGIGNLLGDEGRSASAKQLSYSAIMKKEPLSNTQINEFKVEKPRICLSKSTESKKIGKVTESALSAGYRFKAKDPSPDPRYPGDQQLMIGPIPGHLEHDSVYNNLRSIFQSRGPVCFMFIHKSAVKDAQSGNPVKFGYVVFAERGVAQKVCKEGHVMYGGGHKIKVKLMSST